MVKLSKPVLKGMCSAVICFFLVSCISPGTGEQTQARIDAAETLAAAAQQEADELREKSESLATEKEALQAELESLKSAGNDNAAEVAELREQVARLQALLNDIESMQLALFFGSTGSPIQSPSPSPSAIPSPVPSIAPSPTPQPSPSPAPPPSPSPRPAPSPSPSPQPSPRPSPATGSQQQDTGRDPAILVTGPAPGRTERRFLRATTLFSEIERDKSATWYYHRDAWYDREGIFASISRTGDAQPHLYLHILQKRANDGTSPVEEPSAQAILSFGAGLELMGRIAQEPFGISGASAFEAEIDEPGILILLRALSTGSTVYRVGAEPGAEPLIADNLIDARSKRAMIEVVTAFRDMKNAPR